MNNHPKSKISLCLGQSIDAGQPKQFVDTCSTHSLMMRLTSSFEVAVSKIGSNNAVYLNYCLIDKSNL